MCLFHKWSMWEEYKWEGIHYPGILSPQELRGKAIQVTEQRQWRRCIKCGYTQRKEVTGE